MILSRPVPKTKAAKIDVGEWIDISNEAWREYVYPGGATLRVAHPLRLDVRKKGDDRGDRHRLVAADPASEESPAVGEDIKGFRTVGWYVAPGWIAIRWQDRDGGHGTTF